MHFTEIKEPSLPVPESLGNQYAMRNVFEMMVDDESERVIESFWPVLPAADETEQELEQVCFFCF